jgi:hexosaminidase
MKHAARKHPESFSFPASALIEDAPRFDWRGCHLDTARQFYTPAQVSGFIDILAWLKINRFHWHLTDDEAWRPEVRAYPQLVEIASKTDMATHGHYTQAEMRAVVAKALKLNVEIVPEIDIPGHSWALLQAMPQLADSQEIPESYHSIQGYPNNALNPAIPETFTVLERILGEISDVFPSTYLLIGGDEVAPGAWMQSPAAKGLMQKENLAGTAEMQAWFLRRIQSMLKTMGKSLAGWEEIAHGGGVDPAGTLTFAWQSAEIAGKLAAAGYEVVLCPGQAYYLDLVQDSAWSEPGMSWAGVAPPETTYTFEPSGEKLKGIQACIWSEHLTSIARFNHMVFPRLAAVAESAWTPPERKSFQRFAALATLVPELN